MSHSNTGIGGFSGGVDGEKGVSRVDFNKWPCPPVFNGNSVSLVLLVGMYIGYIM